MSKTAETVQEMARLTMLTNKLNDVQITNLKMYPFVFFETVQEVQIEYDLSNEMGVDTEEDKKKLEIDYKVSGNVDHLHVTYRITLGHSATPMYHMENRYSALEQSVRTLLWKEVRVRVFIGNELKYESPK